MKPADYRRIKPTVEYLQDVARIIGRAQQVYLPVDPNFWQAGLEVVPKGLSSQKLPNGERIVLDMRAGQVRAGRTSWKLEGMTSADILERIETWLWSGGVPAAVKEPELITRSAKPNLAHAQTLADMFEFTGHALADLKKHIHGGIVSPVYVYPHHFDIALSWYPDRHAATDADKHQLTFGFLAGDTHIPEPYFYVTSFPDTDELKTRPWPDEASWHAKGFTGAVLKYNDVVRAKNPSELAESFFASTL